MRWFCIVVAACLSLQTGNALGQKNKVELDTYLSGVTERGRALYAYDQAAWHGTDAFLALNSDTAGLAHYICTKTNTGWTVSFVKWNKAHDRLLLVYQAKESNKPDEYTAVKIDAPTDVTTDLGPSERAIDLTIADFQHERRPYNTAILPAPGGDLYVYLYPGQTKDTVWPLGGDVRYTISADGKQIIEKRQMHKSILDLEYNSQAVAGVHSHVLSDVPEDSDVLYVLNRRPSLPEYIGAGKRMFIVNTDGTISVSKK